MPKMLRQIQIMEINLHRAATNVLESRRSEVFTGRVNIRYPCAESRPL